MNPERIPYMSFLLRLWLEDGGEYGCPDRFPGEWRASLEDPHTQAMRVFANLEALFALLLRETSGWVSGEGAHLQQEGSASQSPHVPNFQFGGPHVHHRFPAPDVLVCGPER